jgi:hypothetical protein
MHYWILYAMFNFLLIIHMNVVYTMHYWFGFYKLTLKLIKFFECCMHYWFGFYKLTLKLIKFFEYWIYYALLIWVLQVDFECCMHYWSSSLKLIIHMNVNIHMNMDIQSISIVSANRNAWICSSVKLIEVWNGPCWKQCVLPFDALRLHWNPFAVVPSQRLT